MLIKPYKICKSRAVLERMKAFGENSVRQITILVVHFWFISSAICRKITWQKLVNYCNLNLFLGHYMFVEASRNNLPSYSRASATLQSYRLPARDYCLDINYHMFGVNKKCLCYNCIP